MSRCRTCDAEIIWVRTERGRLMPLDAEPVADQTTANLFVLRDRSSYEAPLALAAWGLAGQEPHYMSHFATCPNAGEHRRSRSSIASPDGEHRGDGRMGTDPVRTHTEGDGEGSRDGGVKPRSQITDGQPPQDPGWRHAGRKYRSMKR